MFINEIKLKSDLPHKYPYILPIVQSLAQQGGPLKFDKQITFLSGENGSGKSTLL